jgi:hypothetical protein
MSRWAELYILRRRKGRGCLKRSGDATERPDPPRVERIAQTIAQKERLTARSYCKVSSRIA